MMAVYASGIDASFNTIAEAKPVIGIVGMGIVGGAYYKLFYENNHQMLINDPKSAESIQLKVMADEADFILICIPTPTVIYQRLGPLMEIVSKLFGYEYKGIVVIKSTILPFSIKEIFKLYSNNLDLLYSPEFLLEQDPYGSLCKSKFHVIGRNGWNVTATKYGDLLLSTEQLRYSQAFYSEPEEAAMMKYVINSFLAMKVTFMNEWYEIAKKENVDWAILQSLFLLDERIGNSHTYVPNRNEFGFGGSCLPKDLEALTTEYRDLKFLPAVQKANNKFREKNDG